MDLCLLTEPSPSPRRVVEVQRLRAAIRRRGLVAEACGTNDPRSADAPAVVVAVARGAGNDASLASWLAGVGRDVRLVLPPRAAAEEASNEEGRAALTRAGLPCAPRPADSSAVTSLYVVGDACTHATRPRDGVAARCKPTTLELLLASHAVAAFGWAARDPKAAPGADAAALRFARVDLTRDGDGDLRLVALDPFVHHLAAHLHPPVVARVVDAVFAGLRDRLVEAATRPRRAPRVRGRTDARGGP